MYTIYNNVEDKNIFTGNEDANYSILGVSDAIEYIEDFCDNLEIIN